MSVFWFFGPFFDYFFLLSKVSKMKFYQKSLNYKNTTLYDIDFPEKIGFLRFFLRKFLLTVLHIFDRKYTPNFQKIDFSIYPNILKYNIVIRHFMLVPTIKLLDFSPFFLRKFLLSVFYTLFMENILINFFIVQSFKNEITSKILDTQKYNIVRHWFSSKNWIFSIFFKKVTIDGFTHFWSKIHPKFSKNRLFHIPQYIIYLWSEFYARSNNQTIRIFG